jgi:hypothetical protein
MRRATVRASAMSASAVAEGALDRTAEFCIHPQQFLPSVTADDLIARLRLVAAHAADLTVVFVWLGLHAIDRWRRRSPVLRAPRVRTDGTSSPLRRV